MFISTPVLWFMYVIGIYCIAKCKQKQKLNSQIKTEIIADVGSVTDVRFTYEWCNIYVKMILYIRPQTVVQTKSRFQTEFIAFCLL